jgi:hypothetical protein
VSAPTRECLACEGTGYLKLPVCWGICECGHGGIICPVCLGSGRVDSKASRADAIADAETLRGYLWQHYSHRYRPLLVDSERSAMSVPGDGARNLWHSLGTDAFSAVPGFTDSTGRAVPGLRGAA